MIRQTILFAVTTLLLVSSLGSGNITSGYNTDVAAYYDAHVDTLITALEHFRQSCNSNKPFAALRKEFLACRGQYKTVSFFVEQFDPKNARLINGPDLLRIEDDTRQDSTQPHGFQHIEAILYTTKPDRALLKQEALIQLESVQALRQAPDHRYYFRNDRVWEALRSGTYRVISMGITGFDVPLSEHAIPETVVQLKALKKIVGFYREEMNGQALCNETLSAFDKAIAYAEQGKSFDAFDRLVFIREYMNPLCRCLKQAASTLDYINHRQLTPLNPDAEGLFDTAILDINFFSPNSRYQVTPERVALGRKLFYDTRLSGNGIRSCASCHQPGKAFSDGLVKGRHINGSEDLPRNTPTLWNSAFQTRQFYDSRALVLETQLNAVVHSTAEMGGSLHDVIPVLLSDTWYRKAFEAAYRNDRETISEYTIANAISSYIRTLTGFNSRFDRYIRKASDSFTSAEQNGFNLFMGKAKCGTCHYAPVFNGIVPPLYEETESEILAVPADKDGKKGIDPDEGKFLHTKVPLHRYAFKTPTVRNIALTAPYMHNGVFRTLEEVINFYNNGGGAGLGILLDTQTLPAEKLGLTKKEKQDLIAFLNALTDTTSSSN